MKREVTNSSDKVKSESKPPAFVSVSLLENKKDFKVTNNMLDHNTQAGKFMVGTFSCFAEGLLGWFMRCFT